MPFLGLLGIISIVPGTSSVAINSAAIALQTKIAAEHVFDLPLNPASGAAPLDQCANLSAALNSLSSTTIIDFYYALDGSSYTLSYGTGPIPAGWSNGTGPVRVVPQSAPQSYTLDAEGYVDVTVAAGLQANSSFNITLSANDGATTQTESVPVQIKASCTRHY